MLCVWGDIVLYVVCMGGGNILLYILYIMLIHRIKSINQSVCGTEK